MEVRQLQFVDIALSSGGTRRFFFRESSRTDRNVIHQIFKEQHYSLSHFPLSRALKNYANRIAAGASLLVVDAGANIGASALYLTQLDPRIHVCAIEPEPGNFSVLKANSADLPITAIEAALASETGNLWLTDPGIGEWGFRVGRQIAGASEVVAVTMADILTKFDTPRYQRLICKIDIEGGESELFRTNDAWIDEFPLIIIELHDWLLPGTCNSKNFLSAISKRNFDLMCRGENVFCFNNDLLSKFA